MLHRAYRLSSSWKYFTEECDRLRTLFSNLRYLDHLIDSAIFKFTTKVLNQPAKGLTKSEEKTYRIVLPFKDQRSADRVRNELKDLSCKIHMNIQSVFTSQPIAKDLKVKEKKPELVNQQSVVYLFKCGSCDASYVGYTRRHLHQRVEEHKKSTIGIHQREHGCDVATLMNNFHILKRCKTKLDCLIYEMLLIKALNPSLNIQSDSIRAKIFT